MTTMVDAVEAIKVKKAKLNSEIAELLKKFSEETGCTVDAVEPRVIFSGGKVAFYLVSTEVSF